MATPPDNRMIIAIGAGLAVVAAVVLALIFGAGREQPTEAPPASKGGLTVDLAEAQSLEPTRELRCFVNGQFVGMATLTDCAQRNGLATDALDVGFDASGSLTAAPTASLAPPPALPPTDLAEVVPPVVTDEPTTGQPAPQPAATGGFCQRYTGSEWRSVSNSMSLNACVQALYAGTCVRPGDAQYGRWNDLTLRLVPGRVEQSNDNSRFRTLVEQNRSCAIPEVG
ncbi:hypothetical protein JIP62_04845 [Brevundimonas vitis]|uniref:YARHG domain-containing protein n=1 Tax=Brevundimonas vitisensis TaxID=2800818 RepID=A0ABX7BQC0_9CAUL|nr:hypothetical protein [Brevundimonas vitisensis]QQQ19431.1 hypothetical protein JIP62_04845 [Brevundimonas vitisensis]